MNVVNNWFSVKLWKNLDYIFKIYLRTIFKNDINICNNYKINKPVHFVAYYNNSIISHSEASANKFKEYFVNI